MTLCASITRCVGSSGNKEGATAALRACARAHAHFALFRTESQFPPCPNLPRGKDSQRRHLPEQLYQEDQSSSSGMFSSLARRRCTVRTEVVDFFFAMCTKTTRRKSNTKRLKDAAKHVSSQRGDEHHEACRGRTVPTDLFCGGGGCSGHASSASVVPPPCPLYWSQKAPRRGTPSECPALPFGSPTTALDGRGVAPHPTWTRAVKAGSLRTPWSSTAAAAKPQWTQISWLLPKASLDRNAEAGKEPPAWIWRIIFGEDAATSGNWERNRLPTQLLATVSKPLGITFKASLTVRSSMLAPTLPVVQRSPARCTTRGEVVCTVDDSDLPPDLVLR